MVCCALHHHDGVIHDDADRKHDGEQSRHVDSEAERGHGGESADDGDRYRGHGHQHGAPVLQEHDDHDQHQDRRFEQRLPHFVDRSTDERRGIKRHAVAQPLRKVLGELRHFGRNLAGHVERVRLQRLVDADACRRLAVEREDLTVGLGAELDAADVAQVDHLPVLLALDHDVFELADVVEAGRDVERILERLGVRAGRHAELTSRDLLVLAVEGVDDVFGRERKRVELVGVEPYPHRILPRAEDVDLAHTRQPGKFRLQIDGRIIGEEQAVIPGIGGCQRNELEDSSGFLLNRHALGLHRLRQLRERAGDPVLHQHLREVDVHPDLESDDERIAAVGGAVGLHIDHAVDAVDLLLDRQSDGVDHSASARPGVAGRH